MSEFELNREQERVVGPLSRQLQRTSVAAYISCGLAAVALVLLLSASFWGWALLPAALGVYLFWVARSLQKASNELALIPSTEGADASHLMTALQHLNGLYRFKLYLLMAMLAVVLLLILAHPAA